jgi:hypothetical protein
MLRTTRRLRRNQALEVELFGENLPSAESPDLPSVVRGKSSGAEHMERRASFGFVANARPPSAGTAESTMPFTQRQSSMTTPPATLAVALQREDFVRRNRPVVAQFEG